MSKIVERLAKLRKNLGFSRTYAHMLIVVAFLVVKKHAFLVITHDHGSFGGHH